jgi:hypothetical protein
MKYWKKCLTTAEQCGKLTEVFMKRPCARLRVSLLFDDLPGEFCLFWVRKIFIGGTQ